MVVRWLRREQCMASVVLFHSAYGLRPLELRAAERLRGAGHHVVTPDLYGGRVAANTAEAMTLRDTIGWRELCDRAANSIAEFPATAVLGGFSLGAGIAASLWPSRPETAALLLLHGIFPMPEDSRSDLPMQVHLAEPDEFESEPDIDDFVEGERRAGSALEIFRYAGAGHLYTDDTLPDFHPDAAELTWQRVIAFLGAIPR
jgi:dienelactone hydrolase